MTDETGSIKRTQLKQLQALPLPEKIQASLRRIRQWKDMFPDATVFFSGGLDSTVLLDLVRMVFPSTPGVFADTGLEYPEIREFVSATPNIIWVKPRLDFLSVVRRYGYPVISKRMAQYIGEVQRAKGDTPTRRLRLTGITGRGTASPMGRISTKWQFLCSAGLPISDKCCDYIKKQPMKGFTSGMVGVRTEESSQREQTWYREGCNSLTAGRSWPIAFWTDRDIHDYIEFYCLPYSRIYDMGYPRTGCMFCMFGLHLEKRPNRFDRMAETHPQIFRWCMDGPLKLREVCRLVYKMEFPSCP